MSENFSGKDYGEYFKNLEQNLNREYSKKTNTVSTKKSKKKKGFYRVFRLKKSFVVCILAVLVMICGVIITSVGDKGKENTASRQDVGNPLKDASEVKKLNIIYDFPENTPDLPVENDAKYGIIIDKSTNKVVAARNATIKAYPASTTKIMTLLIAVENLKDMNKTFTMSYKITDPLYIEEASVAGFLNGETVKMNDLLYGAILPSGADASMALALTVAGSEDAFVDLMNKKVKELGLKNTHFDNVTGLHSVNNYTTVYDMAVILDAAMRNDICRKILSTYQFTTSVTPEHPEGILLSSTLFNYMYGTEPETATILGGKTGFVNESGYCIASFGKANESNKEYIVVTFGNSSRWPAFHGQISLYKDFAK